MFETNVDEAEAASGKQEKPVARPLKVLVGLIQEDLDAAEKAGMEHYRAAGEKLIEAREQVKHGQFGDWIAENFKLSSATAYRYMTIADPNFSRVRNFKSQNEFFRQRETKKRSRRPPIDIEAASQAFVQAEKAKKSEREERAAKRALANELIDVGFKSLAMKYHPDKGGTTEVMTRLKRSATG